MSYVALYRKWRPQRFEQLVGQEHISRALKNALAADKLAHAYLLCGPRGTGKTTTAKIIAKTVNCLNSKSGEPCNQCEICETITNGNFMDILEIDGASNRGIEEIRALKEKVNLVPTQGMYKVYIIDEVHMLTPEAFNALLKTLEEPPRHVIFIFATTEPHKLPPTILSRCQRFDFYRISIDFIVKRLEYICEESKIPFDKEALVILARLAQGGMRDALSLMDQCLSYGEQKLEFNQVREALGIVATEDIHDVVTLLFLKDIKQLLYKLNVRIDEGKDIRQFAGQCLDYIRNLLIYKSCDEQILDDLGREEKAFLKKHKDISVKKIHFALQCISKAEAEMRWSNNPRLLLEMAFFKYIFMNEEISCSSLENRLRALEERSGKTKDVPKEVHKEIAPTIEDEEEKYGEENNSSSKLELEKVEQIWALLLEKINEQKKSARALLVEGNPIELTNGCLLIEFPANRKFHKEKIEQPDNKSMIEEKLADICGQSVKINFILAKGKSSPKKHLEEQNQVDCAHNLFGGDMSDLKK